MKKLFLTTLCFYPFITFAANEGVLETANCGFVKGWAWDNAQPTTPIKVDIYDGVTKVATVIAKLPRPDSHTGHGFVYNFGAALKNGAKHNLKVKFNPSTPTSGTNLTGSPKITPLCIGQLNDTGWQTCSNGTANNLNCPVVGFKGQDGDYGRDPKELAGTLKKIGGGDAGFDFTKIANNGAKLPPTAVLGIKPGDWACTLDNVTGKLWEVKTDNGGLRDKDHTYSWFNPASNINGGDPGTQNGGVCGGGISCDTLGYVQAVNAKGLCGKKDWRLPKLEELRSMVDYEHSAPAIDSVYFPNTASVSFWSASPSVNFAIYAWFADLFDGDSFYGYKGNGYAVRLVRGVK